MERKLRYGRKIVERWRETYLMEMKGKNKGRSGDKNTWRKKYCSEGEEILETWRDREKNTWRDGKKNTKKERISSIGERERLSSDSCPTSLSPLFLHLCFVDFTTFRGIDLERISSIGERETFL